MEFIASLIVNYTHFKLFIRRIAKHVMVFLGTSPFKWKSAHREVRYQFSYRKYS